MLAVLLMSAYLMVGDARESVAPSANRALPLATDCTLFASPSGRDANPGTSPNSPKTFVGAAKAAVPGTVVCLKAGTYERSSSFAPPRSGTSTAWITYKAYGDGPVNIVYTGTAGGDLFKMVGTKFPNGPAYLEFSGLNLDGRDTAKNGFLCLRSHHLRFTNNYIKHFGAAGIATVNCDYVTSDRNFIYHNGYVHGWTSGISYNGVPFYDDYGGFHNIVSNNIVSGEYDASSHHTDGNGIIFDLSADRKSGIAYANTPAGLIINNVVYQNGGRCIQNYTVTNIWVVNNTCYKNTLDTSIAGGTAGEIVDKASRDNWYVNNVVYSWESKNPAYKVESGSTGIRWYKNMYWVGGLSGFAASGPNEFIQADPLFTDPPRVLPGARNQHADALPPHQLGKGLRLRSGSPARNKGIDPTVLPNVSSHILDDLKKYVYQDVDGAARPRGGRFDLGAYSELNITHSDRP